MRVFLRVVVIALGLCVCAGQASAEDITNAVRAFMQYRVDVEKKDVAMVAGMVDEHGIRVVGYGKLDNGTGREADGDTLFEVGSITKTFTTLLLQDMVGRGEMRLEDPVEAYLPKGVNIPSYKGRPITLLDLATHTSGLPFIPDNLEPRRADNPQAEYTVEKLNAFLSGFKLTNAPGSRWSYSELGMELLGYAIERKAGTTYESLLADRICRPLRMDSTSTTLTPDLRAHLAVGHNELGYAAPSQEFQTLVGGSALRTTANDLLKYVSANLGLTASPLTPLMEKTHVPRFKIAPNYQNGIGWIIMRNPQGRVSVGHNGATPGYGACVSFDKARRRGVVALASSDDIRGVMALTGLLLETEWESGGRPLPAEIHSQAYEVYPGHYRLEPNLGLGTMVLRLLFRALPGVIWAIPAGVAAVMLLLRLLWGRAYVDSAAAKVWRFALKWLGVGRVARRGRFRRAKAGLQTGKVPGGVRPRIRRIIFRGMAVCAVLSVTLAVPVTSWLICVLFHPGLDLWREGGRLRVQVTISPVDPRLRLVVPPELTPQISAELLQESEGSFFERISGIPVAFARDAHGKVTGLGVRYMGSTFAYEKMAEPAPEAPRPRVAMKLDPKMLDSCVGRYEFGPDEIFPAGVSFNIERRGERLVGETAKPQAGWGAFDIYPESETNFFLTIVGTHLVFTKNAKGEVTSVVRRIEGWPDSPAKRFVISKRQ